MVSVPVQLQFCKGETSNHCGVFSERLFGLGLMLLRVSLPIVVGSFQLRLELLQCSLGFVALLVVSFLELNPSPRNF
jgi:hypothetical protein